MFERMEFCPKCNGIRGMSLSLGLLPIDTPEGPDVVLVYHYHCTSCNSYVRSKTIACEETSLPEDAQKVSLAAYA